MERTILDTFFVYISLLTSTCTELVLHLAGWRTDDHGFSG